MIFFSRSGFTTSPSVSPLFWLGDQLPTWDERDGMASALSGTLAARLQPDPRPPTPTLAPSPHHASLPFTLTPHPTLTLHPAQPPACQCSRACFAARRLAC